MCPFSPKVKSSMKLWHSCQEIYHRHHWQLTLATSSWSTSCILREWVCVHMCKRNNPGVQRKKSMCISYQKKFTALWQYPIVDYSFNVWVYTTVEQVGVSVGCCLATKLGTWITWSGMGEGDNGCGSELQHPTNKLHSPDWTVSVQCNNQPLIPFQRHNLRLCPNEILISLEWPLSSGCYIQCTSSTFTLYHRQTPTIMDTAWQYV